MKVQHASISTWQMPAWAEVTCFNPFTQEVEPSGFTKDEWANLKSGGSKVHEELLLQVSNTLKLTISGKPTLHLGNMSSPHHTDHPLVWQTWLKKITTSIPWGLAQGPDGLAYE